MCFIFCYDWHKFFYKYLLISACHCIFIYQHFFMCVRNHWKMCSQSKKKKKKKKEEEEEEWNTLTSTNYRRAMKLVPINMDYCLLQFGTLKFVLGVRLHVGSLPNFNFFNANRQNWQRNREVHHSNCLDTNFHNISDISL